MCVDHIYRLEAPFATGAGGVNCSDRGLPWHPYLGKGACIDPGRIPHISCAVGQATQCQHGGVREGHTGCVKDEHAICSLSACVAQAPSQQRSEQSAMQSPRAYSPSYEHAMCSHQLSCQSKHKIALAWLGLPASSSVLGVAITVTVRCDAEPL